MAENMDVGSFDDLLHKAEHLIAEIDDNLPFRIERNIKQLYEVGQTLWSRTGYQLSRDTNDVRASVLLGSQGYDLQKVSQQLENLNATKKLPTVESGKAHDIHGFLRNERENAVLSAIEKVKNRTFEMVDLNCWNKIEKDWDDQKRAMLDALVGEEKDLLDSDQNIDSKINLTVKSIRDDLIGSSKESESYSKILSDLRDAKNERLIVASVSRIVRENKNYNQILGYLNENGTRTSGLLDLYHDDPNSVIKQVAIDCENAGLIEESIKLYDLCGEHSKAIGILNKHLNQLVSAKKSPDSKRDKLEAIALKLAERFCKQTVKTDKHSLGVLYLLLDLMTFFDYYHNQAYEDAIDIIQKLNILPFHVEEVDKKVNEFGSYSEEIRRNVPDILVATMNILYAQYQEIRSLAPKTSNKFGIIADSSDKDAMLASIRLKARLLLTYTGMIPYRMPGDTNSKLVQLEILMN